MQGAGERRVHGRTDRNLQLDMQRAGIGLHGAVGACARQPVLPVTAGRQSMHRRGFGQQTLVDTLLFPVTGLEVRAEHPQVDQCELTPDQPRQQRRKTLAGDRVHRQVERDEDRRLHQLERHRGRHREDFPLVGQVVTAVVIVRVDTDLLLTTEHQHRRPGNNQRPQRQQLFALQRWIAGRIAKGSASA